MKSRNVVILLRKTGGGDIKNLNSTVMNLIMLINIKMPTIADILLFISRINTTSESSQKKQLIFSNLVFMSS